MSGTDDITYRTDRTDRTPLVPPGGVELHARDMSATFSADVTLAEAQARLAELGQWLPVDGDPSWTLGRLVEMNSTGPLRLGYGAWRDLLLGCQFLSGRGELISAGGRTVKNVAGYDLTKFMVGQAGIFGRLVTITTRTYRRPEGSIVARFPADVWLVNRLLPTPCRPQWIALTRTALRPPFDHGNLLVGEAAGVCEIAVAWLRLPRRHESRAGRAHHNRGACPRVGKRRE